jgi:hypothetical protein
MVESVIDPGAIRQFVRDLPDILSEGHRESPEGAQPREFERDAVAQRVFSDLAMAIGSFRDVPTRVLSRAVSAPREFARAADAIERDFRLQAGWVYWRRFLVCLGVVFRSTGKFCVGSGRNVMRFLSVETIDSEIARIEFMRQRRADGSGAAEVERSLGGHGVDTNSLTNGCSRDLDVVAQCLRYGPSLEKLGRLQLLAHTTNADITEAVRTARSTLWKSPLYGFACGAIAMAFVDRASLRDAEEAADHAVLLLPNSIVPRLALLQVHLETSRYAEADRDIDDLARSLALWPESRDMAIQYLLSCSSLLARTNESRPQLISRLIGVLDR